MWVAHCTAVKTGVVELHVHHQTRELANVLFSPGCRGCDATVGTALLNASNNQSKTKTFSQFYIKNVILPFGLPKLASMCC